MDYAITIVEDLVASRFWLVTAILLASGSALIGLLVPVAVRVEDLIYRLRMHSIGRLNQAGSVASWPIGLPPHRESSAFPPQRLPS